MGASGLGALLVKEGFLTEQDRVTITKTCGQGSWAFAKCILSTGLLDEDELSAFFAERTKYVVAPKNLLDRLDTGIIEQIDRRMVSRLEVLPLEIDHHRITVAVADPLDKSTIKQLEFFTGLEVVPVIAPLSQIYEGLSRLNPEFRPRPTALSNFLRNHAGAAWIKQKIVEEGDVDVPQEKVRARGTVDDYDEDQVEEVSLDDEIDALEESSDSLSDIDAGGLDEGIGNSDFDDIELEDAGGDLDLAPGDDPDEGLAAGGGEPIDDAGLDLDDPFDNFDDAPKPSKKVAAPSDDDLAGLESGGDASDDLWPDADEAPKAAPAKPKAKAAAAAKDVDFGLDDDEPKAKKQAAEDFAADDLLGGMDDDAGDLLGDEEPKAKKAAKADADDLLGGMDDDASDMLGGLDDDEGPKAKKAAKADADDLLGGMDDDASDMLGGLDDDETPKAKKVAKADADDLLGGMDDDASDMLGGLDDDEAPKAKKAAKADADDLLGGMSDDADDLLGGLDDDGPQAKKAAAQDDDLLGGMSDDADDDQLGSLDDAAPTAKADADDLLGGLDDSPDDLLAGLDDEAPKATKPAAKTAKKPAASDDLDASDDLMAGLDDAKSGDSDTLDDDIDMGLDADNLDALLDEPAPPTTKSGSDLLAFQGKAESTRMATKPAPAPTELAHDDDHESVEFADDDETSVSLRKAVHEDGVLPEFNDPSADGIEEETRIDLHAAVDDEIDSEFGGAEDTNIKLASADEADEPQLEDLAMGFDDQEAIDEPAVVATKPAARSLDNEPAIDDFGSAEIDDIPIDEPAPPKTSRVGGQSAPKGSLPANGSVASLTATAKANEALLRMSLCFDRDTALDIAREYLPQISGTGCLIESGKTAEPLATWRPGAQAVAKGKASSTIQSIGKAAKPGQWSQVPVPASDELFGAIKSISIYAIKKPDGRTLILAGDYPLEDETLREALTSFAEQLGAK